MEAHDRMMLRFQWFAIGVAATCFMLAFSLPGFWQTAVMMGVVAVAIGIIRRRCANWHDADTVHETAATFALIERNPARWEESVRLRRELQERMDDKTLF